LTLTETKTENKIGVFVRNQSIVVPIAAIFVAFVLGGILIFLQGVNPLVAYRAIFSEAWFDSDGLLRTFQKTTPLVLAGLAVTVGLRVGLFNIGAQGQLISAALASALAGIYITNLPPILHVIVALFCGVIVGALWAGIAALAKAERLNEVGAAIEDYIDAQGKYGILEDYVGHGIGRHMHEEPPVYHFRTKDLGPKVTPGLAVAIEPMVTAGSNKTKILADGWTVVSKDSSDASHWEHSVAVTDSGVWVLTAIDGGKARLEALGVPFGGLSA
jgi:hypothetical protein